MTMTDTDQPALEDRARTLAAELETRTAERDAARKDAYRMFAANIALDNRYREQLADRDETIRGLRRANEVRAVAIEERDAELARHRRAAAVYAALEQQPTKPARPTARPLSSREQVFATVIGLALIGVLCGLAINWGIVIGVGIAGFTTLCLLALSRSKPAGAPLFDMPVNASKWEAGR